MRRIAGPAAIALLAAACADAPTAPPASPVAPSAPPGAKVLSKPIHLREIVSEVERMIAA